MMFFFLFMHLFFISEVRKVGQSQNNKLTQG